MKVPQVEILPFEPQTATREEWERYHRFRRLRHNETDPEDPVQNDEVVEELMKRPFPQSKVTRFVVVESGKPKAQIGYMAFEVFKETSPSYESNKHLAEVDIAVLAPYRKRGVGRVLLAKAAELTKVSGRTLLVGGSEEDDGKAFIKAIGAELALQGRENRLALGEVNWKMVEGWERDGRERNPECSLLWFTGPMDEEIVDEYCQVLTETLNQQPFDNLQIGDIVVTPETNKEFEDRVERVGATWLRALTQEPDGRISGLTEMRYQPDLETLITQGMTGVKQEYRGRGLGKWLKAGMLLRVRGEYTQVRTVVTRNATSNVAMLSINDRLGFKPHKEAVASQIRIESLDEYLGG